LEELFFRGIVLRFLHGKISTTLSIGFSALLFSMLHFNLQAFIPIFILGLLLGISYTRTGDIRAPIVMHMLFNGHTLLLISADKWLY